MLGSLPVTGGAGSAAAGLAGLWPSTIVAVVVVDVVRRCGSGPPQTLETEEYGGGALANRHPSTSPSRRRTDDAPLFDSEKDSAGYGAREYVQLWPEDGQPSTVGPTPRMEQTNLPMAP